MIDISIPDHPTLLSVFNEPMPMAYGKKNSSINVMDVVVAPPYAYILDQNAVRIIDISDSKNPKGLGIYSLPTMPFNNGGGASRSLAIEGSKLFVVDNAAGLLVLDVTDPTTPKLDSELHLPGIASWVFVENGYVYVAGGEGGLFIIQYNQNSSRPFRKRHTSRKCLYLRRLVTLLRLYKQKQSNPYSRPMKKLSYRLIILLRQGKRSL